MKRKEGNKEKISHFVGNYHRELCQPYKKKGMKRSNLTAVD